MDARGEAHIETTPMPAELLPRLLASPSMLAHVAMEKVGPLAIPPRPDPTREALSDPARA